MLCARLLAKIRKSDARVDGLRRRERRKGEESGGEGAIPGLLSSLLQRLVKEGLPASWKASEVRSRLKPTLFHSLNCFFLSFFFILSIHATTSQDAGCLSGTVTVLLWLLEARSSELIAATATTSVSVATAEVERRQGAAQASGASASEGGVGATPGDASRGDGEGIVNGGAASVVRLMRDVFDRCVGLLHTPTLAGRFLLRWAMYCLPCVERVPHTVPSDGAKCS